MILLFLLRDAYVSLYTLVFEDWQVLEEEEGHRY